MFGKSRGPKAVTELSVVSAGNDGEQIVQWRSVQLAGCDSAVSKAQAVTAGGDGTSNECVNRAGTVVRVSSERQRIDGRLSPFHGGTNAG